MISIETEYLVPHLFLCYTGTMSKATPLVYMATNSVTGERYVGYTTQTLARRRSYHIKGAMNGRNYGSFAAALRVYGPNVFTWEVLAECDDPKGALAIEQAMILAMAPEYNGTCGGGAYKPLVHSQKTRAMLRDLGHKNIETFKKYAALGPAARARRVICLDDGAIYDSAGSAARAHGVSQSMIIEVCNRNPRRKTAVGKVFRYVGDDHNGVSEAETIHLTPFRNGKNPCRGVYQHVSEGKNTGKWRARVNWGGRNNRRCKWLGIFETIEEAQDAYLAAMEDLKARGLR